MKKIVLVIFATLTLVLVIVGSQFVFQTRNSNTIKFCHNSAYSKAVSYKPNDTVDNENDQYNYERYYQYCLREKGLEY